MIIQLGIDDFVSIIFAWINRPICMIRYVSGFVFNHSISRICVMRHVAFLYSLNDNDDYPSL